MTMTDFEVEENLPPVAHVTIRFVGPVAPHWEMRTHFGEDELVEAFWARVYARLLLLPKHDPQFRRNRERVNRDGERERITVTWDLGDDDEESTHNLETGGSPEPATAEPDVTTPQVETEEAPAEEPDSAGDEDSQTE